MALLDFFRSMGGSGLLGGQQAMQAPQGTGLFGGLTGGLSRINEAHPGLLMGAGSLLAGNDLNPAIAYGLGAKKEKAARSEQMRKENATKKWLMGKGIPEEEIDAAIAAGQIGDYFKKPDRQSLVNAGEGQLYDPNSGEWIVAPGGGSKPTDDLREYEYARQQGYDGTFQQYQTEMKKAGATTVNNQLPAEMGARIGLGDAFLNDFATIESKIKSGALSDVSARAQLAVGAGEPAALWRAIESGKEALVRNLTGAGMSVSEAQNQANRYQISATDSQDTMLDKVNRLKRDLEATRQGAIAARNGTLPQLGGAPAPAGGGQRLRFNPQTGELE